MTDIEWISYVAHVTDVEWMSHVVHNWRLTWLNLNELVMSEKLNALVISYKYDVVTQGDVTDRDNTRRLDDWCEVTVLHISWLISIVRDDCHVATDCRRDNTCRLEDSLAYFVTQKRSSWLLYLSVWLIFEIYICIYIYVYICNMQHTATTRNKLHHTTSRCNTTLQHHAATPRCITTLHHHAATTRCTTTLHHHTAPPHCTTTLQHTATYRQASSFISLWCCSVVMQCGVVAWCCSVVLQCGVGVCCNTHTRTGEPPLSFPSRALGSPPPTNMNQFVVRDSYASTVCWLLNCLYCISSTYKHAPIRGSWLIYVHSVLTYTLFVLHLLHLQTCTNSWFVTHIVTHLRSQWVDLYIICTASPPPTNMHKLIVCDSYASRVCWLMYCLYCISSTCKHAPIRGSWLIYVHGVLIYTLFVLPPPTNMHQFSVRDSHMSTVCWLLNCLYCISSTYKHAPIRGSWFKYVHSVLTFTLLVLHLLHLQTCTNSWFVTHTRSQCVDLYIVCTASPPPTNMHKFIVHDSFASTVCWLIYCLYCISSTCKHAPIRGSWLIYVHGVLIYTLFVLHLLHLQTCTNSQFVTHICPRCVDLYIVCVACPPPTNIHTFVVRDIYTFTACLLMYCSVW